MSGNNSFLDNLDYSIIVEDSRDAVSINIAGTIIYANKAFSKISGYSVEEIIGKHIDVFNTPALREKIMEIAEKRQRGEPVPDVYKTRLVTKSGEEIDIENTVKLINVGGKNASLAYVRDITDQLRYEKRLESVLTHSRILHEANSVDEILSKSLDIIVNQFGFEHVAIALVEEEQLVFKYGSGLNEIWRSFTLPLSGKGITVKAVKTKTSQLILDTRKNDEYFTGVIYTGSSFLSELDVPVLVDDEVYAVINIESTKANTFSEEDRKIIELFSATIGGSIERLRLREEQINNSNLLNALVNNLPILTRRLNTDGVITEHKGSLLDTLGLKQGQSVGRNFLEMYPEFKDEIQRALDGEVVEFEREFVYNGKMMAWRNFLIPANTVHGVISFAIDISEIKLMQEELLKNERLSAIGRISSIVGHELRNPLGVINNSRYYLNLKLSDADPKIKRHLEIIQKEVDRSNVIISDLLDFARGPKPPVLIKTDLNKIIELAIQRVNVPPRINLEYKTGELPDILLDSDMILRVFINLISNAIDAIKEEGTITIQISLEGDELVTCVKDTGEGITNENMVNIFQPLFTTKTKGVGLGLFTSKTLVESHDGSIEVQSTPHVGTMFTIRLPLKEDA